MTMGGHQSRTVFTDQTQLIALESRYILFDMNELAPFRTSTLIVE